MFGSASHRGRERAIGETGLARRHAAHTRTKRTYRKQIQPESLVIFTMTWHISVHDHARRNRPNTGYTPRPPPPAPNLTPSTTPRPASDHASPTSTALFVFCVGCAPASPALHPAAISVAALTASVSAGPSCMLLLLRRRSVLVGAFAMSPASPPPAAAAFPTATEPSSSSFTAAADAAAAAAAAVVSSVEAAPFAASKGSFDAAAEEDDALALALSLWAPSAREQSPRELATSIASAAHFDRSDLPPLSAAVESSASAAAGQGGFWKEGREGNTRTQTDG